MSQIIPLESLISHNGAHISHANVPNVQPRLPSWLKVKVGKGHGMAHTAELLRDLNITTVCQEARCPNIGECWAGGTATFMIGGDKCTRNCGFCNVDTRRPEALDQWEPTRVGQAAKRLGLEYIVITSVDRDDLADGGAQHWVETIRSVRRLNPDAKVEILTPDFKGHQDQIKLVADEKPDVYNHNIETVPRIYRAVRPGSIYERSLGLLQYVKFLHPEIKTKSGLMVGLGESIEEIVEVLRDLRAHQVDFITIGQYLRPTPRHLPVLKYYHPDEFEVLRQEGEALGFEMVASGPFVRSSYHAGEDFDRAVKAA